MLNSSDHNTISSTRNILTKLLRNHGPKFKALFLDEKPVSIKNNDLVPLLDLELITECDGRIRSNYRIYPVRNCFIITDQFSNRRLDRVFPISDDESGFLASKIIARENEVGLDMGTGSGIYAVVAAQKARKVFAVDINPQVRQYVLFNAALNGVYDKVEFVHGDVFENLNNLKFDFIVSDPPVVPVPKNASFWLHSNGGQDGSETLEKIFEGLSDHLGRGARLQMVLLSLENGDAPIIVKLIQRIFEKRKYKVDLTELYGKPLLHLESLFKLFKHERQVNEWRSLIQKKGYNRLHYFYLYGRPSSRYSILFHEARIGNWKARLERLSPT